MRYIVLTINLVILLSVTASAQSSSSPTQSETEEYNRFFTRDPITQQASIKSVPVPSYTKAARRNKTEGIVELRVVLASSGQVTQIVPLKVLPDGLTEKAVEVARKIKFNTAKVDGHPVSMWFYLTYDFSLSHGVKVIPKNEP